MHVMCIIRQFSLDISVVHTGWGTPNHSFISMTEYQKQCQKHAASALLSTVDSRKEWLVHRNKISVHNNHFGL